MSYPSYLMLQDMSCTSRSRFFDVLMYCENLVNHCVHLTLFSHKGRVHGIVKGEESTDVAVKCLKEGSNEVPKPPSTKKLH